jgi:hypothetical protein
MEGHEVVLEPGDGQTDARQEQCENQEPERKNVGGENEVKVHSGLERKTEADSLGE